MVRFRILFALVAVMLLVPTGLLVGRALRSVEVEREARHQVVADRLFDEMERALSGFLEDEEDRPFGHYVQTMTGQNTPARSPLADASALPFVVGHFQIGPDGKVTSPRRPPADAAGRLSPEAAATIAGVERTVADFWRGGANVGKPGAPAVQRPGSTVDLKKAESAFAQQAVGDDPKSNAAVSAYDALRSLNKGIEQRAGRQAKILEEYAPELAEESPARRRDAVPGGSGFDETAFPREGTSRENERSRFELSPMVGARVDAARLVLFRTAVHDERIYRQGLLLDVDALAVWLRSRAIPEDLAQHAKVRFVVPDATAAAATGQFVFQHRFAAPFEDLSARLVLAPLPGVGGAGNVYALSTLLLLAVVLGLAAIYRMVAVALRYAEQRSNFVAAVTHELKTPLTAIRMYGEMLRDGMVSSQEKRDQYHRHITAESERLSRLVNNVLEFSRLDKKGGPSTTDCGPLGPVVQEAAELSRAHAESEGFVLRVSVEPGLPPVRLEHDALLQVLFNLIDNSIKYANGASPKEIDVAVRCEGDAVRLAVRDRGPGVTPRHLPRIFDPFFRGEDELTRRTKGTGLGLTLVRGLVERMGAEITGRNLPTGGFEVEITFAVAPR